MPYQEAHDGRPSERLVDYYNIQRLYTCEFIHVPVEMSPIAASCLAFRLPDTTSPH